MHDLLTLDCRVPTRPSLNTEALAINLEKVREWLRNLDSNKFVILRSGILASQAHVPKRYKSMFNRCLILVTGLLGGPPDKLEDTDGVKLKAMTVSCQQ